MAHSHLLIGTTLWICLSIALAVLATLNLTCQTRLSHQLEMCLQRLKEWINPTGMFCLEIIMMHGLLGQLIRTVERLLFCILLKDLASSSNKVGSHGGPLSNVVGMQRSMEYEDLLLCHKLDTSTPIEETVKTMNYVTDHGRAFYWATNEWSTQQIIKAWEIAKRLDMVGQC